MLGPRMKCLLIPTVPLPIALWTVVGILGSVIMGIGYSFVRQVMETFRAISEFIVPFLLLGHGRAACIERAGAMDNE